MGNRKRIIVTLSKTYDYPSAVLDPQDMHRDAIVRAERDILNDMRELRDDRLNPQQGEGFFIASTKEDLGFAFRKSIKDTPIQENVHSIVNKLATYLVEKKYKTPMNPDESPDLFVFEEAQYVDDLGERVKVRDEQWYLKPDVESYFNKKKQEYLDILYPEPLKFGKITRRRAAAIAPEILGQALNDQDDDEVEENYFEDGDGEDDGGF